MAEQKKKKFPTFITPKGTFKFPKLNEPDYGSNDYPKPDGEYSVKLVVDQEDEAVKAFLKKLEALHKEAVVAGKEAFKELKVETRKKLGDVKVNDLFTVLYDRETEEPTGEIEFKFAMKASGEVKKGPNAGKKWTRNPAIFDAKGVPMKKAPSIWGGTIGKVSFQASPYFIPGTGAAGLKLSLEAVQVLELVSGGQKSASQYGFGEEEGYAYEEPAAAEDEFEGTASDTSTPGGSDDDEF